jgi:hypothetical protein
MHHHTLEKISTLGYSKINDEPLKEIKRLF